MVRYLVLHTNGTFTEHTHAGPLELQKIKEHLNGGYMTLASNTYTHNKDASMLRRGAVLIADEDGIPKRLPTNSWSFALAALGYVVPWAFGGYYGPLILAPRENKAGNMAGNLSRQFDEYLSAIKQADDGGGDDLDAILAYVEKHGTVPGVARDSSSSSKEQTPTPKKRPRNKDEQLPPAKKTKKNKSDGTLKAPRVIKTLHQQIMSHPDYKRVDPNTRWAFEMGCVGTLSTCNKENNAWSREIWRALYLGQPMKDGSALFANEEEREKEGEKEEGEKE